MSYYIRSMRREDIPQVMKIDREAFPTMLPPLNFERELRNQMTHYYVVCDGEMEADPVDVYPPAAVKSGLLSRIRRWFNPDGNNGNKVRVSPDKNEFVCGYVGFWVMADEAHITTIAVRSELQRRGIGELLLMAVVDRARKLFATVLTLEVRVSNTGAQNLYLKYGFTQAGVRRGYYTDNREDAYIMTTGDITSAEYHALISGLSNAHSDRWGEAEYLFT